ncbi:hypothetical protein NPIL_485151 [Nephila pilipes]|uniref:Uncharacterized protein n=1 Tax=Nephila pilipes TaxID=299642 RepID=A0A8X6PKZ2_NEPPI|nr:hypothetical protein NPIL_485151 [Nephila pilipes]
MDCVCIALLLSKHEKSMKALISEVMAVLMFDNFKLKSTGTSGGHILKKKKEDAVCSKRKVVNQPSPMLGKPNLAEIFGSDFASAWLPFSAMPCQNIVADALSELINMHIEDRETIIWRVSAQIVICRY